MRHVKTYNQFNEDATANASTTAGMGAVCSAQPGSLPGTTGTSGSGDIPFYFRKERRKKGNPSQVTDLRDLKPEKTNKVKDIKEGIDQELTSHIYDIMSNELELSYIPYDTDENGNPIKQIDPDSMQRAAVKISEYIKNFK